MTTPNESTAAEVYAARRNNIARLMDVLQMELERHEGKHQADPANWGFAGDLGKLRGDLVNIVAFMSGKDPAEVEEFLEEAE